MMSGKKNVLFTVALATLLAFTMANAQAQSLSGRGVDSRAMGEVSCVAEIERLAITVQRLETQREAMIECNENGGVFTGEFDASNNPICEPLAPLTAVWSPDTSNPDDLHFFDDKTPPNQVATYEVTRGRDGEDAECPGGYEPQ